MRYYRFLADVTCCFVAAQLSESSEIFRRVVIGKAADRRSSLPISLARDLRKELTRKISDHQTGINSIKGVVEEQTREIKKLLEDFHLRFHQSEELISRVSKSTLKVSITSSQRSLAVITGIPANGPEKNMINGLHQISGLSSCVAQVCSDILFFRRDSL
jgi:hypothetical protein